MTYVYRKSSADAADLMRMSSADSTENATNRLEAAIRKAFEQEYKLSSVLFKIVLRTFMPELLYLSLLSFSAEVLTATYTFLIRFLIEWIRTEGASVTSGYLYAFLFCVVMWLAQVARNFYMFTDK